MTCLYFYISEFYLFFFFNSKSRTFLHPLHWKPFSVNHTKLEHSEGAVVLGDQNLCEVYAFKVSKELVREFRGSNSAMSVQRPEFPALALFL